MNAGVSAQHVVLIGAMGAGKTTVGEICAQRLRRPFVDTDALVVANAGRSIKEIFATDGEAAFRTLERSAVADACAAPIACVVACGGGAVLDAENRAVMRAGARVVWLRAEPQALAARLHGDHQRPLLASGDPETTLRRLVELRTPAYEAAAHVVVDTDGCAPGEIAAAVLDVLNLVDATDEHEAIVGPEVVSGAG